MPKVAVHDMQGNTVDELELNEDVFAAAVNEDEGRGQRRWS